MREPYKGILRDTLSLKIEVSVKSHTECTVPCCRTEFVTRKPSYFVIFGRQLQHLVANVDICCSVERTSCGNFSEIQPHAPRAEREAAVEAHVDVLAIALHLESIVLETAGGVGAGEPNARGGRPQPQWPYLNCRLPRICGV